MGEGWPGAPASLGTFGNGGGSGGGGGGGGGIISSGGATGRTGDERWRHFDSSVSAVSFGFVATAVLISMFLLMAIFERFLRPRSSASSSSRLGEQMRGPRMAGFGTAPDLEAAGAGRLGYRNAAGYGDKLGCASPKMSIYSKGVSVLMPGQAVPTFIAHPAPVPCPPERISWPSHDASSATVATTSNHQT